MLSPWEQKEPFVLAPYLQFAGTFYTGLSTLISGWKAVAAVSQRRYQRPLGPREGLLSCCLLPR